MKKTFTFFAAVVLMTTVAFAQNNGSHQRDNNYGNNDYGRSNPHDVVINDNPWRGGGHDDRSGRGYYFTERDKNMQIAQINDEYFHKIQSVKNKFFMGRYQKERIINSLQFQRESEIRSVWMKFNDRNNRFNRGYDRHDDDDDHDHDRRNW